MTLLHKSTRRNRLQEETSYEQGKVTRSYFEQERTPQRGAAHLINEIFQPLDAYRLPVGLSKRVLAVI